MQCDGQAFSFLVPVHCHIEEKSIVLRNIALQFPSKVIVGHKVIVGLSDVACKV